MDKNRSHVAIGAQSTPPVPHRTTLDTMSAALRLAVVVLAVAVAGTAGTLVCPQALANAAGLPRFCASNSYGLVNVNRAEFENWNCNHPFNSETRDRICEGEGISEI